MYISFASASARLIFPQQRLCTYFFRDRRRPPFSECTGCHGNGAQVGRGELRGTLRPPRRAAYIKTNWRSVRRREKESQKAQKRRREEGERKKARKHERAKRSKRERKHTRRKRELKCAREEVSQRGSVQARSVRGRK